MAWISQGRRCTNFVSSSTVTAPALLVISAWQVINKQGNALHMICMTWAARMQLASCPWKYHTAMIAARRQNGDVPWCACASPPGNCAGEVSTQKVSAHPGMLLPTHVS